MTADEVRNLIIDQCAGLGSQKAWAYKHGISEQYVSDVINGRRDPGETILHALGLECVVSYEVPS